VGYIIVFIILTGFVAGNIFFHDRPIGMIFPGAVLALALWISTTPREKTNLNEWGYKIFISVGYILLFIGILDAVFVYIKAFP
jgi:hypothetical protein